MQACGPAQNVSMLPHTPGTVPACASAFASLAQRSGLHDDQRRAAGYANEAITHFHISASAPYTSFRRLIRKMGVSTISPSRS
jgi:hypothetical protein